MPSDAERAFWWLRRRLGLRDRDESGSVDLAIREVLELYSLQERGLQGLERVLRRRLQASE